MERLGFVRGAGVLRGGGDVAPGGEAKETKLYCYQTKHILWYCQHICRHDQVSNVARLRFPARFPMLHANTLHLTVCMCVCTLRSPRARSSLLAAHWGWIWLNSRLSWGRNWQAYWLYCTSGSIGGLTQTHICQSWPSNFSKISQSILFFMVKKTFVKNIFYIRQKMINMFLFMSKS